MCETSKNERLKQFVDYLKYSRIVASDGEFADYIGKKPSFVSEVLSGKRPVTDAFVQYVSENYSLLNPAWIISGEGEMLKSSLPATSEHGIPFYDMDVTAGITESFHDMKDEAAQFFINFPPLNDCDAAFPVYGESMIPDFYPGEVILVREIHNVDSMLWGEPYLIITNAVCDNLRTIKNVYLSDNRKSFILRATNEKYAGDTIVHIDNVLKIFLVKGKVNRRQL